MGFRFSSAPNLMAVIELQPHFTISWVDDADAPGGRRIEFTGYAHNVARYFAKAMNFT